MLRRLQELAGTGKSFAFESTLASRTFAVFLRKLKTQGYRVDICYVWLNSIALAQERVALRVRMGGHHIPPDVVARRYARSVQNFRELYLPLADKWSAFDNSLQSHPLMIAEGNSNTGISIYKEETWATLLDT